MSARVGSSNGPDWTDIAIAMAAIEDLHGVSLSLEIVRAGALGESGVLLIALARRRVNAPGEVSRSVSRRVRWPSDYAATMEAAAFRLVYEMDRDCTQFWVQEKVGG